MQGSDSPLGVQTVRSAEVAKVLTDAASLRLFVPFLARDCKVSAAARELGEKPNSMLYRVKRWHALGLLRVARVEHLSGRSVRVYRSSADAFFVPHEVTDAQDLIAYVFETNEPYLELLYESAVRAALKMSQTWGMRFYRDGEGRFIVNAADGPDRDWNPLAPEWPALLDIFSPELRLSFKDAKTLQLELSELLARYSKKRGGDAYIAYFSLAPLAP